MKQDITTLCRIIDQKDNEIKELKSTIRGIKIRNARASDFTWLGKDYNKLNIDELREFCEAMFDVERYCNSKILGVINYQKPIVRE